MSDYKTLLLEMKGDPGTSVDIGIKDSNQPDDGTETKVAVTLTGGWQTVQIPLSKFTGTNLQSIYVFAEFVFSGSQTQTLRVRSIRYSSSDAAFTKILRRSTGPPLRFLMPTDPTAFASRLKRERHAKFQYSYFKL
jgi:hypothetical protein